MEQIEIQENAPMDFQSLNLLSKLRKLRVLLDQISKL